jgi:serine/threonine protein kinase
VGAYRLLAKIGEGGMGVVHLAQAPDGKRVALKVLRPHVVGDDEARQRLAREVASLRRVRSPRIAEIIDADPWGATPFVATRYVPGLSLHDHVRQDGPILGDHLRHFAAGLAEALLAVHSVGVLHRDVKPSNVLLEGRSPVLIDFGLARLAEDPRLTVTGWLLGTPGYLAPEILYGEDATTASDVHSWAATVVFAATGRPPFGRGPAMAIMDRVRRGEHDLAGVPADLLPLLTGALAPEPAARPTLPSVLADLRPRGGAFHGSAASSPGTMPLALAPRDPDPDRADVLGTDGHVARLDEVRAIADTIGSGAPPTTPMTVVRRTEPPSSRPPEHVDPWRPPAGDVPRTRRGVVVAGLFVLVTFGFALAPYLCLAGLAVAALALRTWSRATEAARDRSWRRGRRWYDGPLAAVTAPWYLLVATGGTLMLLLWSAALTFLAGLALFVAQVPLEPALLIMGSVLALMIWWGPGARRVRTPTRALVLAVTQIPVLGSLTVAVVVLATAVVGYLFLVHGVSWDPQPGPPWRRGTPLGGLVRLL